jgi:hypothetical protein
MLPTPPSSAARRKRLPEAIGRWTSDRAPEKDLPLPWVWDGLLVEGAITLLTGVPKAGKSTLLAMLLERRREGGLLLDRPVRPGVTLVVSEEPEAVWADRQHRFDLGPNVCFARPCVPTWTLGRWRRFFDDLTHLGYQGNGGDPDLLVIDSLASFLPGAENHARTLVKALEDLKLMAEECLSVLLVHHPRRAAARPGHSARGSSALEAAADILLDFRIPPGDPATRRRCLYGIGRYPTTPAELLIEMNAEATDYAILADRDLDPAAFAPVLDTLRTLLAAEPAPLTRHEILARWPSPATRPTANTLWRWLSRACELGVLVRQGEGSKTDAFRYGVAASGEQAGGRGDVTAR